MHSTQGTHFSEDKKKSAFIGKDRKPQKVSENTGIFDGTNAFVQVRSILGKETDALQQPSLPKET